MPWKECHVVDERLRFVGRMLDAEKMAPLCAEFGISRKTGSRSATAEHRQSEAASRADRALRRFYPRVTRPQQSSRTLKLWMERVLSSNRVPAAYVSGRPVLASRHRFTHTHCFHLVRLFLPRSPIPRFNCRETPRKSRRHTPQVISSGVRRAWRGAEPRGA